MINNIEYYLQLYEPFKLFKTSQKNDKLNAILYWTNYGKNLKTGKKYFKPTKKNPVEQTCRKFKLTENSLKNYNKQLKKIGTFFKRVN